MLQIVGFEIMASPVCLNHLCCCCMSLCQHRLCIAHSSLISPGQPLNRQDWVHSPLLEASAYTPFTWTHIQSMKASGVCTPGCVGVQRGERSSQVWCAVLGCLLHLVTHCGHVVRGYLQGLPLKALAALMHCCRRHHWCDAVYCHLVRLAANMMYAPAAPTLDSGENN